MKPTRRGSEDFGANTPERECYSGAHGLRPSSPIPHFRTVRGKNLYPFPPFPSHSNPNPPDPINTVDSPEIARPSLAVPLCPPSLEVMGDIRYLLHFAPSTAPPVHVLDLCYAASDKE